jgi:ribokinase
MIDTRKPIVVVGSINMDLCARVSRLPHAGQTLIGNGFEMTPGGKGANQAVAVARLGYPVWMVGKVGSSDEDQSDMFGHILIDHLGSAGVGTEYVERVTGPSGVAQILVADSGENVIVVIPGANGKMDTATVDRHAALIRSAGMVLCQLELPLETTLYTLALCAEADVPVMLDPAPAAHLPDAAWSQITWFTPNETEAAFYLGQTRKREDTAKSLLSRGLRGVVLKEGSKGVYVAHADGETASVGAFPVQAVDTVAAGDCFNGAFAVALLECMPTEKAARFAAAAAAISVTRKGAQSSMPTRAEVDDFLRQAQ